MAAVSLSGLNSGIDTSAIIQQLMAVEGNRLTLLQNQQTSKQQIQTNLSTLQTKLNAFQTAVKAIDNSQELRSYNATSSDSDLATATASYSAFEGNHTVEIHQLASAERIVHAGKAYAEDLVGAGKFIYSYNHKETTITTTATTTLQDLANLINNDPENPGVTASILKYDDGNGGVYHLVLGGNNSGADYDISINASNTNVLSADSAYTVKGAEATGSTKITELDQFSGTLGTTDKITISGTDKNGTAITSVDLTITHDTTIDRLLDAITSAYGGTATATLVDGKIRLTDNTDGTSSTSLSLAFNGTSQFTVPTFPSGENSFTQGGSVTANLAGFESGTFTQTQAAANAELKVDGYPLNTTDGNGATVEHWLERSSNTLDDIISGVTLDLHAPGTVQINLTRQTDALKVKLNAMVSAYNDVITYIKEQTAYDTTTKTAGVLMGNPAVADIQTQIRSPLMGQISGFTKGVDSFVTLGQIGLSVDSAGKLTLDETKLSDAIAKNYTAVLDLIGAVKAGSSDSNAIKFYSANDNTTAGTYNVEVTFANGVITSARMKSSSDSNWRSATVSGNSIIGNSQFDKNGRAINPENGLSLTAEYSGSGTLTATIRVKEGFAGNLASNLKDVLDSQSGVLKFNQDSITASIKQLQDRIDREQTRLTKTESNLKAKFARMEAILAQLQQQQQAINNM
jgi:flagellar hook-associated protein 2